MKISAALTRVPQDPFTVEELDIEAPRAAEILVRLVASGVCHTDLVTKQLLPSGVPFVLGHEGAGVVEEVGQDVTGIRPGDKVLLSYRSCGACGHCRSGHPTYCEQFRALNSSGTRPVDGSTTLSQAGQPVLGSFFGQSSFATYVIATPDNAVVVPQDTDLRSAAPLGCSIQTGAGAVLNVLRPQETARVVIYGAGGVGLAALMAAKASGAAAIVAVDPVPSRRELALKLGATAVVDPAVGDVVEAVRAHTGGGATHALDTTAVPTVIAQGVKALAARGTLVAIGLGASEVTVDITDLIANGKTLRGCIEGDAVPHQFLPRLLELRAQGLLPVEELITFYPFTEINQAVADSVSGLVIKPVLLF